MVVGAALVVLGCAVVVGAALVVVVLLGGGVVVVVVVDGSGGAVVVVAGGGGASLDGGGGAGTTVTVVLSFGPVMVTVCGGAGVLGGDVGRSWVDLVSSRLIANTRAISTAAPAPATLNTSAVRLYQGSPPAATSSNRLASLAYSPVASRPV